MSNNKLPKYLFIDFKNNNVKLNKQNDIEKWITEHFIKKEAQDI